MQQAVNLHETAAAPLGSFPAIFSQAISLGLLSKRRVYQEAMQALKSEQGSLRSLIGECFMSVSMLKLLYVTHMFLPLYTGNRMSCSFC